MYTGRVSVFSGVSICTFAPVSVFVLLHLRCQYLYCCTSKASKLSTSWRFWGPRAPALRSPPFLATYFEGKQVNRLPAQDSEVRARLRSARLEYLLSRHPRCSLSLHPLLPNADVCWRMLTYADVRWMASACPHTTCLAYADVCWRMLTYADVCWRMLNGIRLPPQYADVRWRMPNGIRLPAYYIYMYMYTYKSMYLYAYLYLYL
jgi:hypothetical protein